MEITSFILGVCAVIVIMMIVGTSVNHMTIKVLRKEIKDLTNAMERNSEDLYRQLEKHVEAREKLNTELTNYTDILNNNTQNELNKLYGYVDSRGDKLDYNIGQQLKQLEKEISRVERGYKEKINY
jgi:predicted Holliday junction resolvase-like endonuclease